MTEIIGMMEGAFFVSRGELLQWANKTYDLNLTKIEQFGTGAVYCQILDSIHPGKVNMSKVNWRAKLEWEFINNLKILQQSFLKCSLNKYIEIEKLSKAKYQDNLEFAQWMKRYYDLSGGAKDYDPAARRGAVEPDFSFADKLPAVHINNPRAGDRNADKSFTSKRKNNSELRSLSPSMKYNKNSNLLGKKGQISKELEDEIKRLQKNLKDIKAFVLEEKIDDKEKLSMIGEIVESSLQSKLFKREALLGKKSDPSNLIEKISETNKEN